MKTITINVHERWATVWIVEQTYKSRKCKMCGECHTENREIVMRGHVFDVSWSQRDNVRYSVKTAKNGLQRWVPPENVFAEEEAAQSALAERRRLLQGTSEAANG